MFIEFYKTFTNKSVYFCIQIRKGSFTKLYKTLYTILENALYNFIHACIRPYTAIYTAPMYGDFPMPG